MGTNTAEWKLFWLGIFSVSLLMLVCQFATAGELLGDGSEVAAKSGAAPQSQVEEISIPYDSSLPTFKVAIEPAVIAAQDIVSGGGVVPGAPDFSYFLSNRLNAQRTDNSQLASSAEELSDRLGHGIAAQLTSGLAKVGNLEVYDYGFCSANPDQNAEMYIVRPTLTEFTETNSADQDKKGFSTLPAGKLVDDVGDGINAFGGNSGVANVFKLGGRLLVHTNKNKREMTLTRTGVVGLDIQIIQADTGRIIASFPCQGTFTTQSATQLNSAWGRDRSSAEYQASALNQASRAALNQAVTKIHQAFRQQAGKQVATLSLPTPNE